MQVLILIFAIFAALREKISRKGAKAAKKDVVVISL